MPLKFGEKISLQTSVTVLTLFGKIPKKVFHVLEVLVILGIHTKEGTLTMLKELVLQMLAEKLFQELGAPNAQPVADRVRVMMGEGKPQRIQDMISKPEGNGPLFFSDKEVIILELLMSKGPMKQAEVIVSLELDMNANTIRELLSNLIRRRIIQNGPEGYEIINRD